MDFVQLVHDYLGAWNQQDVAGVLSLCARNAYFFDTYWMERCPNEQLADYFRECFEESGYWYQLVGDPIELADGVAFRYTAHAVQDGQVGPSIYDGAEMLLVRGRKIVSMTDYYWNPDPASLAQVASMTKGRRGRPRVIRDGLPGRRASRFSDGMAKLLDGEKLFLDPNLTLSQVADRLGCPVKQLTEVISTCYGSNFYSVLDEHRASYARQLLLEKSDDPDYLHRVAAEAGFRSVEKLNFSFKKYFDVSPAEFLLNLMREAR